ncbi:hypothetical protein GQ53DRAFT_365892 [Thozetella sp. PMI_491]|nr:hypothetical protein GQ53DRAFT_365892 [Thozetella sp. PMI_491]
MHYPTKYRPRGTAMCVCGYAAGSFPVQRLAIPPLYFAIRDFFGACRVLDGVAHHPIQLQRSLSTRLVRPTPRLAKPAIWQLWDRPAACSSSVGGDSVHKRRQVPDVGGLWLAKIMPVQTRQPTGIGQWPSSLAFGEEKHGVDSLPLPFGPPPLLAETPLCG